jgi:Family of unknown function (DUF6313)
VTMPRLIPLLQNLVFRHPDFELQEFAAAFIALHLRRGGWKVAQSHWELIVAEFLRARELRDLRNSLAMAQAVVIAAGFLTSPGMVGECPVCHREDNNRRAKDLVGAWQ